MKNKVFYIIPIVLIVSFFSLAYKSGDKMDNHKEKKGILAPNKIVATLSYTTLTSTVYNTAPRNFSKLDISAMKPTNEKQSVKMEVHEDGAIDLTIVKLAHPKEIKFKHKTLPNDVPEITKSVVKNGIISFYDSTGKLVHSQDLILPKKPEMVKKLKTLDKEHSFELINKMTTEQHGAKFMANLDDVLKNPAKHNVTITKNDKKFVTLRQPTGEQGLESVLLINKDSKRVVGSRMYKDNKLVMRMYYGYDNKYRVNRTKQVTPTYLPSGAEVDQEINTAITDYNFDVNL